MDRQPITSSMIASVGYDPEDEVLEVEFKNGQVYQYYDVPESEHHMLMTSSSPGSYLKKEITPAYTYRQV